MGRSTLRAMVGSLVGCCAGVSLAAAPPVGPLTVERGGAGGQDLILSWEPPTMPVDGYRVYRADDIGCVANFPIYLGTQPSFTVVGAFLDPAVALYRVTSLVGSEESEPSPPAYKFTHELYSVALRAWSGHLLAVPYHTVLPNAAALCVDLNGAPFRSMPVRDVQRFAPATSEFFVRSCAGGIPGFPLTPGEGYFATLGTVDNQAVYLWGSAPEDWTIPLPGVLFDTFNLYMLSMPYDHDYPDLMAVAAAVPEAVAIRVNEPGTPQCEVLPCPFIGRGLLRATSSDPWTGDNVRLDPYRGQGLMIGVDIPTTWTIRRQCTGPIVGCAATLLAARQDVDVALYWDVGQTLGAQRYDIYRVDTVEQLANLDAEPIHLSVGPSPTFPIIDVGAAALPDPKYYAVLAR